MLSNNLLHSKNLHIRKSKNENVLKSFEDMDLNEALYMSKEGRKEIVQNHNFKTALNKQRDELLSQRNRPEYQQRHVGGLKGVCSWQEEDIKIQKENNRVLQDGYSELNPDAIIDIAIIAKQEWITDFICPTVKNACKLNIAADLITRAKVSSEDLNSNVQKIYKIITANKCLLNNVQLEIERLMKQNAELIMERAQHAMSNIYPGSNDNEILKKFIMLETQKMKKQITHSILKKSLSPLYPETFELLGIELKPIYPNGENIDYSILGAAGSGKSTISNILIKEDDKLNYIVINTDNYRGVFFTDKSEMVDTDQIFVRTQDSAYSIKELVQDRLTSPDLKNRPNIIVDCVSLEGWCRNLLINNKKTLSTVACLNDLSLVPERTYLRAISETSGPFDKGRQINTSDLLKAHANASAYLITSIPMNVKTYLYDTNVHRGNFPPLLATIDTEDGKHQIEIYNINRLAAFLAKANANQEATYKGELYYKREREYAFTNDSQYRAEQILKLLFSSPPFKKNDYEIILKSKNTEAPYAIIFKNGDNIQIEILKRNMLLEILTNTNPRSELWILQNMIMQIHFKSLNTVREEIKVNGRQKVLLEALNNVIPDIKNLMKVNPGIELAFSGCDLNHQSFNKKPEGVTSTPKLKRIS